MSRGRGTKSVAAAAVIGLFAAHAAVAQDTKNLPPDATAHFVYFPTGGHALDPDDLDHLRDVAALVLGTPTFVVTIIGKTDTVGSKDFNERLSQRRAEAVFESLVYDDNVPQNRVQVCWTGERLPFTSTADETPESQNRMVAIVVSHATSAHFCGG